MSYPIPRVVSAQSDHDSVESAQRDVEPAPVRMCNIQYVHANLFMHKMYKVNDEYAPC